MPIELPPDILDSVRSSSGTVQPAYGRQPLPADIQGSPTTQVRAPSGPPQGLSLPPDILASLKQASAPARQQGGLQNLPGAIDQITKGLNDMTTASVAETGSLGAGVLANVGKLIGNDTLKSFSKDQARLDNIVSQARQSSPVAGAIGKIGTDAGLGLAATGPSVAGLAAGGALSGLASNTGDSPASAVIGGGILGAGLGLAGKVLSSAPAALGSTVTGGRTAMAVASNPDDFANSVISSAIDKAGGKDISPAGLIQGMRDQWKNMDNVKDVLYSARDSAAQAANGGAGVTVDRSGLSNILDSLKSTSAQTSSPQVKAAIGTIQDVLQNAGPVPYTIAQTGMSNLGKEAASADRAGNNITSALLRQASDALDGDIGKSLPDNSVVSQLHDNATQFMKNIYYPMKDAQLDTAVADRASETKFLANLTKQSVDPSGPNAYSAMASMDPSFQRQLIGAHINAIKDAVTQDGQHLDMQKFANSLNKTVNQYSSSDGSNAFGAAVTPMRTLANVLSAANTTQKGGGMGIGGLAQSALGGTIGFHAGGPVGAIAGAAAGQLIAKTPFLYAAGKMLNNPAAMDLLHSADQLSSYPKADMTRVVSGKVIQSFNNQFGDIPKRLMPAFGVGQLVGNK